MTVRVHFIPYDAINLGLPSGKLTVRPWKSTILMVFTRKDGDFHGRTVSLPEGRIDRLFTVIDGICALAPLFFAAEN